MDKTNFFSPIAVRLQVNFFTYQAAKTWNDLQLTVLTFIISTVLNVLLVQKVYLF